MRKLLVLPIILLLTITYAHADETPKGPVLKSVGIKFGQNFSTLRNSSAEFGNSYSLACFWALPKATTPG